jgi:hypothetical protein
MLINRQKVKPPAITGGLEGNPVALLTDDEQDRLDAIMEAL